MVDISKQYWWEDAPNDIEQQKRISNVLNIREYFLRLHKVLQRPNFKFKNETFFCQSSRKSDRMCFSNSHIERPLRKFLHHVRHGAARRHGGCNPDNLLILFGKFHQRVSENILVELRLIDSVSGGGTDYRHCRAPT